MKLIVQIPCYNKEHTLPQTVADIPRQIEGVDQVKILIINDGSQDRTIEVAREIGADYIFRNKKNCGLALTFRKGIDACLELGADIGSVLKVLFDCNKPLIFMAKTYYANTFATPPYTLMLQPISSFFKSR